MKIPVQLSIKFFDEQTTIKKKVDDMHIGEFIDMNKNLLIPIFGETPYENAILNEANKIKRRRSKNNLFHEIIRFFKTISDPKHYK
jgi:hypothetical protein